MSLIGPRPLLPQDQPANSTSRLVVRPGITGWAFAAYDQQLEKELGGETANLRAISSVVRTIDAPKFNDRFSAVR